VGRTELSHWEWGEEDDGAEEEREGVVAVDRMEEMDGGDDGGEVWWLSWRSWARLSTRALGDDGRPPFDWRVADTFALFAITVPHSHLSVLQSGWAGFHPSWLDIWTPTVGQSMQLEEREAAKWAKRWRKYQSGDETVLREREPRS
jgi:hypothetical protein